ncbi:hypothetical protein [Prosthecomicrobium sp. N25]|uniref:hypothetical protein n=1 Tax=Prosthecomicrobium sp. N25 TaxID=3129254 RepID=UPI003076A1E1
MSKDVIQTTSRLQEFLRQIEAAYTDPARNYSNRFKLDRHRHINALELIVDFLEQEFESSTAPKRILDLTIALRDLDNGRTAPFLAAENPGNRPIDPGQIWMARACTALAIQWWIEGGMSKRAACDQVQKLVPELSDFALRPSRRSRDLRASSADWHKQFEAGDVKHELALGTYRKMREMMMAKLAGLPEDQRVAVADEHGRGQLLKALEVAGLSPHT